MGDYILAAVEIFEPQTCHIAPYASEEWTVTDVSRTGVGGAENEVIEEFTLTGPSGEYPPVSSENDDIERVFTLDDEYVFRTARPANQGCACERIEQAGCVVKDITIDNNTLEISFLVDRSETLRALISELQSVAESVSLRRLVEGGDSEGSGEPAVLNRDALTNRQQQAIEVAFEMGYFERPRGATAGEVARELGISTATLSEHLAAAQRKLIGAVVEC